MSENKMKDMDIICFAGEDWWYHNPHSNKHIMEAFAKQNRVLFVNSIGIRMPDLKKDKHAWKRIFSKLKSLLRYLRRPEKNIYVLTPLAMPFLKGREEQIQKLNTGLLLFQLKVVSWLLGLERPILWVCVPTVLDVAVELRRKTAKALVYYCVDNIAQFAGANQDYIARLDQDMHDHSDLAIYVNTDMYEERKKTKDNTFYLPHGVDYQHFAQVQQEGRFSTPEEMHDIPHPVIGYIGLIRGVDFDLIRYLAEHNPQWSFVFVGAVFSEVEVVSDLTNVYFLGRKLYEDLPAYLNAFDCCCLYYRRDNDFDNYRNPKKLMEYFATGKPIVSMVNRQMNYFRDYLYVADTYEEFNIYLRKAVESTDEEKRLKRLELAKNQTWDAIAGQAADYIRQVGGNSRS